jgi:ribosomal protein S18 acetylase RimI-like enzyme
MTPDPVPIVVRAGNSDDEPGVITLWQEVFPGPHTVDDLQRDFRRKLGHQPDLFLVAVCGGQVVGSVLGGYDGHRGHVHAVAVAARFRRRGVGRRLFDELFTRLRAYGCGRLNLLVQPDNEAAIAFYRRLGLRLGTDVCMSVDLGP